MSSTSTISPVLATISVNPPGRGFETGTSLISPLAMAVPKTSSSFSYRNKLIFSMLGINSDVFCRIESNTVEYSRFDDRSMLALRIASSSALCCSVSLSRRWVSFSRRAFSSAALIELARVSSRRTSDGLNEFSRSMFCSEITPRTSSAATSGTYKADLGISGPSTRRAPYSCICSPTLSLNRKVFFTRTSVFMKSLIGAGSKCSLPKRSM